MFICDTLRRQMIADYAEKLKITMWPTQSHLVKMNRHATLFLLRIVRSKSFLPCVLYRSAFALSIGIGVPRIYLGIVKPILIEPTYGVCSKKTEWEKTEVVPPPTTPPAPTFLAAIREMWEISGKCRRPGNGEIGCASGEFPGK